MARILRYGVVVGLVLVAVGVLSAQPRGVTKYVRYQAAGEVQIEGIGALRNKAVLGKN